MPAMCDFIEDYRSSTIFDALGSVGGLLAILQGVHILLFGRPMFWGIAGTKLISPFGIFGGCRSRAFKNRLRERYHHRTTGENGQPMDEPMDAIRINAFLRDFVIDFGPAEIEEDLTNGHGETNISAETRSQPEDNIITNNTTGMDDIPLLPHIQSRQDSESNYLSFDTIILK
ncbi:hypothetical protein BDV93DRAFT_94450 [Ceratobasidium sp. AG-I]|nr:hypothetical protein BDV93DRAFT_94450 [Ceratobasidium sp. AG-I]